MIRKWIPGEARATVPPAAPAPDPAAPPDPRFALRLIMLAGASYEAAKPADAEPSGFLGEQAESS